MNRRRPAIIREGFITMDIPRSSPYSLSTLDQKKTSGGPRIPVAPEAPPVPRRQSSDRRLRPDRRKRQAEFKGEDRRKRSSRRSPSLLHHRSAAPVAAEDRRGKLLDTSA